MQHYLLSIPVFFWFPLYQQHWSLNHPIFFPRCCTSLLTHFPSFILSHIQSTLQEQCIWTLLNSDHFIPCLKPFKDFSLYHRINPIMFNMALQSLLNSVTYLMSSSCYTLCSSHTVLPSVSGTHQILPCLRNFAYIGCPICVKKYILHHSFLIFLILLSVDYVPIVVFKAGTPVKQ